VEGIIEAYCAALTALHDKQSPKPPAAATSAQLPLLQPLLELWDGVCCLFADTRKPAGWLAQLLRVLKLFSEEARAEAAACAVVRSRMLRRISEKTLRYGWRQLCFGQVYGVIDSQRPHLGQFLGRW
jgi:hypothetical protein